MLKWLQGWWPALALSLLGLVLLDAVISSLMTCHPISGVAGRAADPQEQQQCTALAGPMLVSSRAVVNFLDDHGEAVTGFFTIVLAIFTGRLWFSTEKLWQVTERGLLDLERAHIVPGFPRPVHPSAQKWVVNVALSNAGRTFGIVKGVFAQAVGPGQLPADPPADGYMRRPTDAVLNEGDKDWSGLDPFELPTKDEGQILFGYILYEDIFERLWRNRFAVEVWSFRTPERHHYMTVGGPAYNRETLDRDRPE